MLEENSKLNTEGLFIRARIKKWENNRRGSNYVVKLEINEYL
jgi:hypothetical protein